MKILLADDHGLFRDSMAIWLKQFDDTIDIEFAADWSSLSIKIKQPFDLVLLDLCMPGMSSGAASIIELKQRQPKAHILVVSANEDIQTITACLKCGASGYIAKSSSGDEILKAVTTVLAGNIYSPDIEVSNLTLTTFNKKQLSLLAYLAKGEGNKAIAEQMNLSEGTIKQYVSQLLQVLEVDNRTQAANKARQILSIST